jgi:hypothetical protein
MKNTLMIRLFFLLVFPLLLNSQSVFAPKVGAEWQYYFTKEYINTCIAPSTDAFDGIAVYNYTKDTVIQQIVCKKIEGIEYIKYRCGDTQQNTFRLNPLFMFQRNDSVFLNRNNSIILAYIFPKILNSEFQFAGLNNKFYAAIFKDTGKITNIITPFNVFNLSKFIVKSNTIDADFISPIIAERIGPLNTDISVVLSQFEGINTLRKYRLNCYRDSEIGDFKLAFDCNMYRTNTFDFNIETHYSIYNLSSKIIIKANNNESISKIIVSTLDGRVIKYSNNINTDYIELTLDGYKGMLFFQIVNRQGLYFTKKIINF